MPDAAPDDFTPDTHAAADTDFTPDKGTDLPGSVFDKPTVTQRLSRVGKAVTPAAVGTALPIAAGYGLATVAGQPEEGGALTSGLRIAGNTVGGALAPYAEWASQKLMGENPAAPSSTDVIKSAVMNGAFTALGEGGAAATKAAQGADVEQVRGALSSTPSSQRTVANVKKIRQGIADQQAAAAQASAKSTEAAKTAEATKAAEAEKVTAQDLRNRDFWKAHGLNDPQIDQVMNNPGLQEELGQSIEAGNRYKGAYQMTLDQARQSFHDRYTPLLPTDPIETKNLGEAMIKMADGADSPKLKSWLKSEGTQLSKEADPLQGLIPADELATMSPKQRQSYIDALPKKGASSNLPSSKVQVSSYRTKPTTETAAAPPEPMSRTAEQLQGLRTDLRKQLAGNASNTDLAISNKLREQLTDSIKQPMTPEQRGAFDALDQEYGRFQDVINKLDPRDQKYGQKVADAIWDPAAKDPEMATNFIRMAEEADKVHGSRGIMGDLRESFLNKALQQTRTPGRPFEELKALRKLQEQWGGDKNARVVMGELFGKDSPLSDPETFTKVVEAANNPEPIIQKAASQPDTIKLSTKTSAGHNILNSPYMQGMVLFGLGAAASGIKGGGLWGALSGQKGPGAQVLAISSLLAGPPMIGWVVRSGNSPLQKAMVGYLTNPNSANAVRYASQLAGGLGGVVSQDSGAPSMPSPADVATSATGMAPTP